MYLNVPGLRNSSPGHWQSLWEKEFPNHFQRIQQDNWDFPDCVEWIESIHHHIGQFESNDIILIGHSVGCAAIVHWYYKVKKQIKGALLVAPSDVESPNYPKYIRGFSPLPVQKLPFPSIVVASTNDHVVSVERAHYFAEQWGSNFVTIQEAGHIEEKSGFGRWSEGLELLQRLDNSTIILT